jgi:hypothetical protein
MVILFVIIAIIIGNVSIFLFGSKEIDPNQDNL